MKFFFLVVVSFIFVNSLAVAQSSSVALPAEGTSAVTVETPPSPRSFSPLGGIYSYNDFGRKTEETNPKNGRILRSKNEIFTGLKNAEGWGVQAMVVPYFYNYNADPSLRQYSRVIPGDPSLSLMHPIFKNDRVSITGKFRQYFPVSDYSVNRHNWEQTYYLYLAWKLPHRFDFFNILIPRYFSQQYYKDGDTTFYTEDYTTLTRSVNAWIRVGVGQHSQMEVHPVTPVGRTVELYPMADLMLSPTVFLGPRIYFPVYTQNFVYDAPKNVSMDNVQTELFFQATL